VAPTALFIVTTLPQDCTLTEVRIRGAQTNWSKAQLWFGSHELLPGNHGGVVPFVGF